MADLTAGPAVCPVLTSLTLWLHVQRVGHVTVPYLDLWVLPDVEAARLGSYLPYQLIN